MVIDQGTDILDVLYPLHLKRCISETESLLANFKFNGIIIDAGVQSFYAFDDQSPPFRQNPYFSYWCFLPGDNHLMSFEPGKIPILYIFSPDDYWSDKLIDVHPLISDNFKIVYVKSLDTRKEILKQKAKWVYLGTDSSIHDFQLEVNPKSFIDSLNWSRGVKSPYELYCIEQANKKAAKAHLKAKETFASGACEFKIHMAYLNTLQETSEYLPYESIVATDEKSAILHYQHKRHIKNGKMLLIDAGARFNGYCSDITRTYIRQKYADSVFGNLVSYVEKEQQALCLQVKKDVSFKDLHRLWHQKLANILIDHKIIQGCDQDFAVREGLTFAFCPHGLGHMLGLQVHDVSGLQENAEGQLSAKDEDFPKLRTLRKLREYEVITIEPGLYFIPVLLSGYKKSVKDKYFNWNLINELVPFGGIRIEDNLVVKEDTSLNLTRKFLDNQFIV